MGDGLPASDLAGLDANICVLAERTRTSGVVNYRLTTEGRAAVKELLGLNQGHTWPFTLDGHVWDQTGGVVLKIYWI
jgi:hypothetical protein